MSTQTDAKVYAGNHRFVNIGHFPENPLMRSFYIGVCQDKDTREYAEPAETDRPGRSYQAWFKALPYVTRVETCGVNVRITVDHFDNWPDVQMWMLRSFATGVAERCHVD